MAPQTGAAKSLKKPLARLAPLAVLFLLFLLTLAFYRKIALTNLILVDYDLLTYFYPYKEAAAAALQEGRLPLWNPYLFTGVPFLANPQTALLYPLNLPGYALSAPQAVKYSIVFHVFLAGVFMYAFARLSLALGWVGALAAALPFMFGGFLTQQVGHVNQLNAAVWLPLVLLLFDLAWRRRQPLFALLGGLALASQVLAGHPQETFLLLVAFGLYFLFRLGETMATRPSPDHPHPNPLPNGEGMSPLSPWERAGVRARVKAAAWPALVLAAILALGLGLSAAQLLPTLELSRESIRGGGLPYREAVSFSLPPWLLARSLLPSFQDSPFSEYIAYLGILPLLLAAYGLAGRKARPLALFWLGLGLLALFLALGGYNPLHELLYKVAPPLRLFRVPARWLYLYAFALAALAGMGAQRLVEENDARGLARKLGSIALWGAVALVPMALVQWGADRMKEGASPGVFSAWIGLTLAGIALVHLLPRVSGRAARALALLVFLGGELFVAGAFLGHNTATAPQAYDSLRPAVAQLLQDPGLYRILSISRTDFDPGDLPELKSIFGRDLAQEDLYQLLVVTKHQEALSPNIPMGYGIATLDGYDGGVLPLRRYVEFKELLLEDAPLREAAALRPNQADALLRDQLAGIPDTQLLGFLNVKYIITDKVGDLWVDNVYYDLSAPGYAFPAAPFSTSRLPNFAATALGLIYRLEGAEVTPSSLAEVTFRDRSGRVFRGTIQSQGARPLPQVGSYYVRLDLDGVYYPQVLSVSYLGTQGRLVLGGMSLIDGRTGASESLVLDPRLRLVHSGDLKIYQNLDWQARAFIMHRAVWARDDREALALMRRPWEELVLTGPAPSGQPGVAVTLQDTPHLSVGYPTVPQILDYRPEYVLVRAETAEPGYLVLTDSYYPGWRAYLDGQETPILRAQHLLRAVYLPPGPHQVEFRYEPESLRWGLAVSLVSLGAMVGGAAAWVWRRWLSFP